MSSLFGHLLLMLTCILVKCNAAISRYVNYIVKIFRISKIQRTNDLIDLSFIVIMYTNNS